MVKHCDRPMLSRCGTILHSQKVIDLHA